MLFFCGCLELLIDFFFFSFLSDQILNYYTEGIFKIPRKLL